VSFLCRRPDFLLTEKILVFFFYPGSRALPFPDQREIFPHAEFLSRRESVFKTVSTFYDPGLPPNQLATPLRSEPSSASLPVPLALLDEVSPFFPPAARHITARAINQSLDFAGNPLYRAWTGIFFWRSLPLLLRGYRLKGKYLSRVRALSPVPSSPAAEAPTDFSISESLPFPLFFPF